MKTWQILFWLSLILWVSACNGRQTEGLTHDGEALEGSLFYILQEPRRQALQRYDFATGSSETLFDVPVNAWLSHMAAAPDGSQLALTYAPSPGENEIQFGYSSLYLLLADGRSEPRLLLQRTAEQELFFNPTWSPDAAYIYYSHVTPIDEANFTFVTSLERIEISTGTVDVLAESGIWPRLSPDGSSLAYVHIDSDTLAAELILADSDGENPTVLVTQAQFTTLDAPLFSADGEWLYFSAVAEQTSSRTWWEYLLGIEVALAHNLPSEWWRIPTAGGVPEPVTAEVYVGQYGALSPNGRSLAFSSQSGIFVMQPDGSNMQQLLDISAGDSLSWTP